MLTLLAKWFLPDRERTDDPEVRSKYGSLCGFLGIGLNILLFAFKLAAGILSGFVALTADAFNNLTDAASSVITIVGLKLANKKPNPTHPFGHGRMEYIAGLVISALILLTGWDLLCSAIDSIRAPEPAQWSLIAILAPLCGIAVKLYMFAYNNAVGKRIDSAPVRACATDSLNDVLATGIVLVGLLLNRFLHWQLDGWCALIVSLFILKGGISTAVETAGDLLGRVPEEETVNKIEEIVMREECIHGIHDLVVHDYGVGRMMITLHAEVPADGDILAMHDAIDNAEQALAREMGCAATIHMDPVLTHTAEVEPVYNAVKALVKEYDPSLSMHDFRMVAGPTHTNLIFDVVIPFDYGHTPEEVRDTLDARVRELSEHYFAVIQVDRKYTK